MQRCERCDLLRLTDRERHGCGVAPGAVADVGEGGCDRWDDNTPLLSFVGAINSNVCWTPPSGMTARWTFATSTTYNISDQHADQLVPAGSTESRASTLGCTTGAGSIAQLVALDPAG
ncbi:MAG TPA: hypothetical protein VEX36_06945 [Thermoleophilaceae bacterium]|nr:hypothetical protein [Thermoleophilaceae bacterium]